MILIMSGRYQGEREFAESQFPGKSILPKNVSEIADQFLKKQFKSNTQEDKSCIDSSDDQLFTHINSDENAPKTDIDTAAEVLSSQIFLEKNDIILCHIVGCGVVPIDEKQRLWAELVGRTSCLLAKQAEEVWVVRAGIGKRIK